MKISLRKANAIQVSINEVLKGLTFDTEISINEFQSPEKIIEQATTKFLKNVDRRTDLINALYEIRKAVSEENVSNGIDALLAELAMLEKNVTFASAISKASVRLETGVIQGKLEKISQRTEESYYSKPEVTTSIMTEDNIEHFKKLAASLKKHKQKIQDDLLELNVRINISLSESTIETLRNEDII